MNGTTPRVALLTGFGPFGGVDDNPSGWLVRHLDGRRAGGLVLRGVELPVSYRRGIDLALARARVSRPAFVLGFGVRTGARGIAVEALGRRRADPGLRDVDGVAVADLGVGPDRVAATIDVDGLARALGAAVSDDAGAYVCNAWLYRLARELSVPVGFVHVPATRLRPAAVRDALDGWIRRSSGFAGG